VYNGEAFLADALRALCAQTFRDLRILVSDNASTDRTLEICEAVAAGDSRVEILRSERNCGAAANFNRVAAAAETEYFFWANHDDLWHPDYVARCVTALDARPEAVLAYTHAELIDAEGAVRVPLTDPLGLDGGRAHQRLRSYHEHFRTCDRERAWDQPRIERLWTPVYGLVRRRALQASGMIGSFISSDTVLLEELLLHGPFVEVPERLFYKRDHAGRSMRASRAYDLRLAWFDGGTRRRFVFPKWRILQNRWRALARARLKFGDRLRCSGEMASFYVRRGHEGKSLIKELLINAARLTRLRGNRPGILERRLPEVW
jgi:glycosyltransferase involved in cell wall biosynthesis